MRFNYIAIALFTCGGCIGEAEIGLFLPSSSQKTFRIVNGQRLPLHLELEGAEKRSIGFLAEKRDGEEYCTVSIVGPRHVVTAAHCVANVGTEDLFVGFGENPATPDFRFDIDTWKVHPDRDFVVLITESEILGRGEVQSDYSFKAFDYLRDALDPEEWIAQSVDVAGFGATQTDERGLFFASVQITGISEQTIEVNGFGEQGLCYGDSGGPLLIRDPASQSIVIAGTEEWGDESCVDRDFLVPLSSISDWLSTVLLEDRETGPIRPCPPDLAPEGVCVGSEYRSCQNGQISVERCHETNRSCGWMGLEEGNGCLPKGCGQVDFRGTCAGEHLKWCEGGRLHYEECDVEFEDCRWDASQGRFRCLLQERSGNSEATTTDESISPGKPNDNAAGVGSGGNGDLAGGCRQSSLSMCGSIWGLFLMLLFRRQGLFSF